MASSPNGSSATLVNLRLPSPVPEVPVANVDLASAYYQRHLGFTLDWGGEEGGGIAGISRGDCRLFLTNTEFRRGPGNQTPITYWLNLDSIAEVDQLFAEWTESGATILSPAEPKPWELHEFTAADLDGNRIRVFYDFSSKD